MTPKHVSGTIKAEARAALEELANMPLGIPLEDWCRLSARILAAIQPDPEPVVLSLSFLNSLTEEERRGNRDAAFAERGWATPSSAGTVSVEAAAKVLLEACPNPIFDVLKPALMGGISETVWQTDEYGDEVSVDRQVSWDTMKTVIRAALRALAGGQG